MAGTVEKRRANALAKRARKALKEGKIVVVVGWKNSNHDAFTRNLSSKRVKFVDTSIGDLPRNTGLVLFTAFVDHALTGRLKSAAPMHPVPLGTSEIKRVLGACQSLLLPAKPDERPTVEPAPTGTPAAEVPAETPPPAETAINDGWNSLKIKEQQIALLKQQRVIVDRMIAIRQEYQQLQAEFEKIERSGLQVSIDWIIARKSAR